MTMRAGDVLFVDTMLAHGISHLLTDNLSDYASFSEIEAMRPGAAFL